MTVASSLFRKDMPGYFVNSISPINRLYYTGDRSETIQIPANSSDRFGEDFISSLFGEDFFA
jgi:hypothetical protein